IDLVNAVAQSAWSRSKLNLLSVGSAQRGEDVRDEYREMIENAAPEGKIIFIGSVKPTSTARFIARADIAVVPSVGDETTGLAVLEPMSIGIPIITSDSGALSEYSAKAGDGCGIVKRGLGYVTLLAKAIDSTAERLANDPQWREKVSSELREAARDYDSSRFYDRFREQIDDKQRLLHNKND
ncbi:MAG: glycosyltransferase family 4 protein, partial [Candidatus Flemingiibacterium sp.]